MWKYGGWATTAGEEITSWCHPTIPQPSKEQLEADAAEYLAHLDATKDAPRNLEDRLVALEAEVVCLRADMRKAVETK